ncbi:MAG: tryptophanase [Elusimicrobia bacterium]|nr:tryptophanase [Elusimicrobiota bacterium]
MIRRWKTLFEPYRIKAVEPLGFASTAERERALHAAAYNVFHVPAETVLIDLLTDSGTSAMSGEQWAALMRGDEAYAGSRSFETFQKAVRELTGYREVIPAHQGRAAEHILFSVLGGPGKVFLANAHFETTRGNIEATGAKAIDLPAPEAADPANPSPFKGDIDTRALERAIGEHGAANIPLAIMTVTNNTAAGQPVSMRNLREASEICAKHKIPLFLDAARFAENAYLVKKRETGYAARAAAETAREMFSLAQGCWMSAKKDGLAHIGGFLALKDKALADRAREAMVLFEGFPTYGGLAGRDLEAIARGLSEVLDDDYLEHRLRLIEFFSERMRAAKVPIVEPPGGHAVFVDAKAFLPHIPPEQLPASALAGAAYRTGGVRGAAMGNFLRLAVPRRAYTQSHLEYVAEVFSEIAAQKDLVRGLKRVGEAKGMGVLFARLEPV